MHTQHGTKKWLRRTSTCSCSTSEKRTCFKPLQRNARVQSSDDDSHRVSVVVPYEINRHLLLRQFYAKLIYLTTVLHTDELERRTPPSRLFYGSFIVWSLPSDRWRRKVYELRWAAVMQRHDLLYGLRNFWRPDNPKFSFITLLEDNIYSSLSGNARISDIRSRRCHTLVKGQLLALDIWILANGKQK